MRRTSTAAAACAALLGVLWFASFHVGPFQRADGKVFIAFFKLGSLDYGHRLRTIAKFLVSLCDPSRFLLLMLLPILVALARRRVRAAWVAAALVAGANITTGLLKVLVPEPRLVRVLGVVSPVPSPRFPSGHSTAAMSLVLALVFVAPDRLRPTVAGLGAVFAAAVGCSLLTLGSHLPSDLAAGFLVATAWAFLTVGALARAERRATQTIRSGSRIPTLDVLAPAGAALLGVVVLSALVILGGPHDVSAYVRTNHLLIAGAVVIAALSTALSTVVLISVRLGASRQGELRPRRRPPTSTSQSPTSA